MIIHCPSKRCNTTTEHKLKVDTNETICMSCGDANNSVTEFMKTALKSSGDILKSLNKRAFMYGCKGCNANREVYVVKNKAYCKSCNAEIYVPPSTIEAIKSTASFADKEEQAEPEVNEELQVGKIKRTKKK